MRRVRALLVALFVFATLTVAGAQTYISHLSATDFQVNTTSTGSQFGAYHQSVAGSPQGFVVVWVSYPGQDGDSAGVFGQRYTSNGDPVGTEFAVNTYTTGPQGYDSGYAGLAVSAADNDGSFVVVWQGQGEGDVDGIFGRRFGSDGAQLCAEFAVNTYTTGPQGYPSVASAPDGSFVVAWSSQYNDIDPTDNFGIFGRKFNTECTGGTEFHVNDYTTSDQSDPAVAVADNGNFVIVWTGYGNPDDPDGLSISGKQFDADGTEQGPEFLVNSFVTGWQSAPAVGFDENGDFVVVWQSYGQVAGTTDVVFGRRFNNNAAELCPEFQVNSEKIFDPATPGAYYAQAGLAVDDDGSFVVIWSAPDGGAPDAYGQDRGVFARRFDSQCNAGDEFAVNTNTDFYQGFGNSVAMDGSGNFIITWVSHPDQDGDADGVFARAFCEDADGDTICDDQDDCPNASYDGLPCTDDGNDCTDDQCDAVGTCTHPNNTASCDDDLYCNGSDTCSGGTCSGHTGDPCPGADGDANCSESCNETADNCLAPDPNGAGCNDGLFCTATDTCSSGTCVGSENPCAGGSECADSCNETAENCFDAAGTPCTDDGNVCTDDQCDAGGTCTHPNNTASCDDGLYCNGTDTCSGGACVHTGDPCGGQPCNETTDNCDDCVDAGDCDDGIVCTDDSCNVGVCEYTQNTNECDDLDPCSVNDACDSGSCLGTPINECDGITADLPPQGGTVTTDTEADGATASDPVETTVNSPNGGTVSIAEIPLPDGSMSIDITAPTATPENPLVLTLLLDETSGIGPNANVTKDGLLVPDCAGTPGVADPDPCVSGRQRLANNDVEIVISTSTASVWKVTAAVACRDIPATDCLAAGKVQFKIKDRSTDSADQLKWKWQRGAGFEQAYLADPVSSSFYRLCVYDSDGTSFSLKAELVIDAGSNWTDRSPKGLKYTDKLLGSDGVQKVQLKTGDQGRTSAQVIAKGSNVPMPVAVSANRFFDQQPTVIVQLVNTEGGCWTSEFRSARKNEGDQFIAKSP